MLVSRSAISIAFLSATLLASCGGGGTSNTPVSTSPTFVTPTTNMQILETDPDDPSYGVMRMGNVTGSEIYVAVADIAAVQDMARGTISNLREVSSQENGNYYTVVRQGTTSTGKTIDMDIYGYILSGDRQEYVSRSYVLVDNEAFGYVIGGSDVVIMPAGSYRYTGAVEFFDARGNAVTFEDGTFAMSVDFNSRSASIRGSSLSYSFSADNVAINAATGSFSGSSGSIGNRGASTSLDASVEGSFFGENSQGVGGVVYSDLQSNDGMLAGFAGAR